MPASDGVDYDWSTSSVWLSGLAATELAEEQGTLLSGHGPRGGLLGRGGGGGFWRDRLAEIPAVADGG